jgi:multiple sugar transport system substrate-binding protein
MHRQEYHKELETQYKAQTEEFITSLGFEPDVSTVNPEVFGDFMAKMQAAVQAGVPPDLGYHTLSIQQMRSLDIVEDVTDVVDELVKKYGDVVPVNAAKNAKIEGKWWAVPFISNTGAWFARKDVFEAAGVDVNKLTDLNSYREAALKASNPDNQIWGWGITINKSGDGHAMVMLAIQAFGGSVVDQSGQKVVFNSPETIAGVTWLAETYTGDEYKKMLPPGIESWTDTNNNEAYLAGKIALTANAFTVYGKAKKDNNPVFGNTAVIRVPQTNKGNRLESGGSGWFTIFKGSKNVDLAKEAILTLIDPKSFMPMVQGGGGLFLPAYKNLWTDDILKLDPNYATLKEIIFNPTSFTGDAYPADPNPAVDQVQAAAIQEQMMANITSGQMSVEDAVKDAHDKMVQIFEEAGLPQG